MKVQAVIAVLVAIGIAAPVGTHVFQSDDALKVDAGEASSYAQKRAIFKSDNELQVGNVDDSSYATKRAIFESDGELQVDAADASSYA